MGLVRAVAAYFDRKTDRNYAEQLGTFLAGLREMTDEEIAELVVLATHVRHGLEAAGTTVLDPFTLMVKKPDADSQLTTMAIGLQKRGNLIAYAATAVWVHSLRAASRQALHAPAGQMWLELRRGFPLVEGARHAILVKFATDVDTTDATTVPEWLAG